VDHLKGAGQIEVEEPIKSNRDYNRFDDKTFWGYFRYEKEPYFFHETNVYPICYIGNEFIIDEAKFSFFKDGELLEQTLYLREPGDDWRDEEDMDVFDGPLKIHAAWKSKQSL